MRVVVSSLSLRACMTWAFGASLTLSCGGASKDAPPAPVPVPVAAGADASEPTPEAEAKPDAEPPTSACKALGDPMPKLVRMRSQGSHADARVELNLDLSSGRLQGSDYLLEGDDPKALPVDQQVDPDTLAAFRKLLLDTCAPRRTVENQEHSAPGGSSSLELVSESGESLWVVTGASNLAAGAHAATVQGAEWTALFAAWPASAGK